LAVMSSLSSHPPFILIPPRLLPFCPAAALTVRDTPPLSGQASIMAITLVDEMHAHPWERYVIGHFFVSICVNFPGFSEEGERTNPLTTPHSLHSTNPFRLPSLRFFVLIHNRYSAFLGRFLPFLVFGISILGFILHKSIGTCFSLLPLSLLTSILHSALPLLILSPSLPSLLPQAHSSPCSSSPSSSPS